MEISEKVAIRACELLLSLWAEQNGVDIASLTIKKRNGAGPHIQMVEVNAEPPAGQAAFGQAEGKNV